MAPVRFPKYRNDRRELYTASYPGAMPVTDHKVRLGDTLDRPSLTLRNAFANMIFWRT